MTPEYFWELLLRDGTRVEVPPTGVAVVKRRMAGKEPIITRYRVIPYAQIEDFRQTDRPFGSPLLLPDEAAQLFNEPVINPDDSIACRWVKKTVTRQRWEKYYSPIGYKRLYDEGGMVVIAMFLPIHQINPAETPYCTPDEIRTVQR